MEQEIWKDIPWYEWLYTISSIWNKILSHSRVLKWNLIKIRKNIDWYYVVSISNKWERNLRIHRLKAITFIPNPENKPFVNHIDWNKENNELDNLEWCTAKENTVHAHKIWLSWKNNPFNINNPMKWKFWKNNHNSKPVNQYDIHWNFIKKWECAKEIERSIGINAQYVSDVCNWRAKTTKWFIFKF